MQRKHAILILILYLLICLAALGLGLRKVHRDRIAAANGSRETVLVEETGSASSEPEEREEKSGSEKEVDIPFLIVAFGAVVFGFWMGERQKKLKKT